MLLANTLREGMRGKGELRTRAGGDLRVSPATYLGDVEGWSVEDARLQRRKHSLTHRNPVEPCARGQQACVMQKASPWRTLPGENCSQLVCCCCTWTSSLCEPEKLPRDLPETTESGWRGLPAYEHRALPKLQPLGGSDPAESRAIQNAQETGRDAGGGKLN